MSRTWVSEPETADAAVVEATGKGYDEWCDLIDRMDGDKTDHTAVAAHLVGDLGVDPWWAQAITVGYERIVGLRLPFQRPDGTFTASKSKTVARLADDLRSRLLDDAARAELFPGQQTTLRSKPSAKTIRIAIGPGVAVIGVDEQSDGRAIVAIQHEKLPTFESVDEWKSYWAVWLDRLATKPSR